MASPADRRFGWKPGEVKVTPPSAPKATPKPARRKARKPRT